MHIEVEGKTYYINIRDSESGIKVIEEKDDITYLAVPARLSQDKLIAYLKSNPQTNVKPEESSEEYNPTTLPLFDTMFVLVLQADLQYPYLKGKSVYSPKIPKSKASLEKLSETLLIQELKKQIGFWEEVLDILIDDICIRKLKTNCYTVSDSNRRLTFDKNIVLRSRDFIAYICAIAVFDYLDLEDTVREVLGTKYIKDWRHQQKVLQYELEGR